MTFWIQHGYGKGDKLEQLADRDAVGGVVLSPADEAPDTLDSTARRAVEWEWEVAVDPQTFIYNIPQASGRLHADNRIDFGNLAWGQSPDDVARQVRSVVDLNRRLGTTVAIAPTPIQQAFNDVWAPLSLQYARSMLEQAEIPVYASLVIQESAFANWLDVEQWLNEFTKLDVDGLYLIVARNQREYPPLWPPEILTNILRLIYRVTILNRYECLWGYSDLAGLLGVAAGATGIASGWFYTLRSFTISKWQRSTGGKQPIPRVLSTGLLTPLEAHPEAAAVARSPLGKVAIPNGRDRERLAREARQWGHTDAWHQHLRALASVTASVQERGSGSLDAANYLLERLERAADRLARLADQGVALSPGYRTALTGYVGALRGLVGSEPM